MALGKIRSAWKTLCVGFQFDLNAEHATAPRASPAAKCETPTSWSYLSEHARILVRHWRIARSLTLGARC